MTSVSVSKIRATQYDFYDTEKGSQRKLYTSTDWHPHGR